MNELSQSSIVPARWDVSDRVLAFTTTRLGGVSESPFNSFNLADHVGDEFQRVEQNRKQLSGWVDKASGFQWLHQVHGTQVLNIDKATKALEGDALVTSQPNLACCVLTADCLPVFIAAADGSEVAVAHAGWRGLAEGVVENTVAAMKTDPTQLRAWFGPAIGPCHFEVGVDVVNKFQQQVDCVSDSCFGPSAKPGKYLANLFELARLRLNLLGVEVFSDDSCTVCDNGRFYSYRRDGQTGRMANVILIR